MSDKWTDTTVGQSRNPRQKIRSMGKLSKKYHKPKGQVYRCVGLDKDWKPIMEPVDNSTDSVMRRNSGANLFSAIPESLTTKKKKKRGKKNDG